LKDAGSSGRAPTVNTPRSLAGTTYGAPRMAHRETSVRSSKSARSRSAGGSFSTRARKAIAADPRGVSWTPHAAAAFVTDRGPSRRVRLWLARRKASICSRSGLGTAGDGTQAHQCHANRELCPRRGCHSRRMLDLLAGAPRWLAQATARCGGAWRAAIEMTTGRQRRSCSAPWLPCHGAQRGQKQRRVRSFADREHTSPAG
jgi:hypothetical protein